MQFSSCIIKPVTKSVHIKLLVLYLRGQPFDIQGGLVFLKKKKIVLIFSENNIIILICSEKNKMFVRASEKKLFTIQPIFSCT